MQIQIDILYFKATAGKEQKCGSLDESVLYNTNVATEPAEYPWMGILFQLRGGSTQHIL